jgi:hypothetical protein
MESHYCLPLPARHFLNQNRTTMSTAPHTNNDTTETAITMVSVVLSEIILYLYCQLLMWFVIVNEWVSDDYSSLVNISSAISWREQLTLDKIIIIYFFLTIALKLDMSLHSDTLSRLRANQSVTFLCPYSLMMLA